jgi:hypothetical protein
MVTAGMVHRNRMCNRIVEGKGWMVLDGMSIHGHWSCMVEGYVLCWHSWHRGHSWNSRNSRHSWETECWWRR